MAADEMPSPYRIDQLRRSVRNYCELEKAAAEFRGRAAMARWAHSTEVRRPLRRGTLGVLSDRQLGRDGFSPPPAPRHATG
jgi:hypothetical protein